MKRISLFLLIMLNSIILVGQTISSGLTVSPQFVIPLGAERKNYLIGSGLKMEYLTSLPSVEMLAAGLEADYLLNPLNLDQPYFSTDTNLSLINFALNLKGALPLGDQLILWTGIGGGGTYAMLRGDKEGNALGYNWKAGMGMTFQFSNRTSFLLDASYLSQVDLYNGLSLSLGFSSRLGGSGSSVIPRESYYPTHPGNIQDGGLIEFLDVQMEKIFPVLYKHYLTHPIGKAIIRNKGKIPLDDIDIFFSTERYMDNPILSAHIESLLPGETRDVNITALFNEEILSITEGAKLAANLKAEYTASGSKTFDEDRLTVETWHRNAMTWDDDRKIAAFVTPRDEEIQKLARNTASDIRNTGLMTFSHDFQLAIALLELMDAIGCTYVIDPQSSYEDFSENAFEVDSIQFPRQTLQFRAGDCDDLSSAYNALLEAVSIPTAFITVPGHIFSAFKLNQTMEEARHMFSSTDNFIMIQDDENPDDPRNGIWVPVETTALSRGFVNAWELGARQWKSGQGELIAVADAWKTYEPVAFGVSHTELPLPENDDVDYLFTRELDKFVGRELSYRERPFLARLQKSPGDVRILNSLGVLYARYDRWDRAEELFLQAMPEEMAMINMGNLKYLSGRYAEAEEYYRRVLEAEPEQPRALLGIIQTAQALEKDEMADEYERKLREIAPELAERYTSSTEKEGANKASSVLTNNNLIIWEE